MRYTVEHQGDATVFHLEGKLGFEARNQFERAMADEIEAGHKNLVVDLIGVDFLTSDGLAALVAGHHQAGEAGGWLRVVCGEKCPYHIFKKTRLTDLLDIRDSLDDALDDKDVP